MHILLCTLSVHDWQQYRITKYGWMFSISALKNCKGNMIPGYFND